MKMIVPESWGSEAIPLTTHFTIEETLSIKGSFSVLLNAGESIIHQSNAKISKKFCTYWKTGLSKGIFYIKNHLNLSEFFFQWGISIYHLIKLNTHTWHYYEGSIFEKKNQVGRKIFRFKLNFQISKLNLRFQINSNGFSSDRTFGHYNCS